MAIRRDGPPDRERPTLPELLAATAEVPPAQAAKIIARARPAPLAPPARPSSPPPPVVYGSWSDFLAKTTRAARRTWCAAKAKKANAPRLMKGRPANRITPDDAMAILEAARGRCSHCGSLAVEKRPPTPTGPRLHGSRWAPDRLVRPCRQPFPRRPEYPREPRLVLSVVQHLARRRGSRSPRPRWPLPGRGITRSTTLAARRPLQEHDCPPEVVDCSVTRIPGAGDASRLAAGQPDRLVRRRAVGAAPASGAVSAARIKIWVELVRRRSAGTRPDGGAGRDRAARPAPRRPPDAAEVAYYRRLPGSRWQPTRQPSRRSGRCSTG